MSKDIVVTLIAIVVGLGIGYIATSSTFGEVVSLGSGGDSYSSVYISSADASSTAGVFVKKGYGTLGTIAMTQSPTAGAVVVYDATSTTGYSTSTGEVLATFTVGAGALPIAYNLDIAVDNGIILDVPAGFDGAMTITYR